jgi:tetratricopeptide (TPR) repeat protein
LDAAEKMFREALKIEERIGRLEGMSTQYSNLADLLLERNNLNGSIEMFKKALSTEEKLGRLDEISLQYAKIGYVLYLKRDFFNSEEMFKKSLGIAKNTRNSMMIKYCNQKLRTLKKKK